MSKKITKRDWLAIAGASLLTMLIVTCYFAYRKMAPFGPSSLLTVDMDQEYVDFFAMYRNVLLHHFSTLFYSFSVALGAANYGNFTCYIFSPFNLLLLFTPGKYLPVGILIITVLKLGCCAFSCAYFLAKMNWQHGVRLSVFGLVYALSGFVVANMLNEIWFDALIILPLVALGVEKLFCRSFRFTYIFALAAILIINYYMAYMVCVFTCLYFAWAYCRHCQHYRDLKQQWRVIVKFVGSSVVSALMALTVLLPTYYQLKSTKMHYNPTHVKWHFEYNPLLILHKLVIGAFNFNQMPKGTPNIFVGILVLVGIGIYVCNRRIKWPEKLASLAVTVILTLSMCYAPLDLFWHAMQFPVWYPYRFSYVCCFWLVVLAARGLNHISWSGLITGGALALGVIAYNMATYRHVDYLKLPAIKLMLPLLVATLLILVLVKYQQRWANYGLLITAGIAMSANLYFSLRDISYTRVADFDRYVSTLQAGIDKYRPQPGQFYRIGKDFLRSRNDAMQCDYSGTDTFTSMFNPQTSHFMAAIGQASGDNYTVYSNGTLVTDSLLGIKYTFQGRSVAGMYQSSNNNEPVLPPSANRPDLCNDQLVGQQPLYNVYRNRQALPLAFAASQNILKTHLVANQPLANQNAIINGLFAKPVNVLVNPAVQKQVTNLQRKADGNFAIPDSSQPATVTLSFTNQPGPYYVSVTPNPALSVSLNCYNASLNNDVTNAVCLAIDQPDLKQNQVVLSVNPQQLGNGSSDFSYQIYHLQMPVYKRAMRQLQRQRMQLDYHNSTHLTGTVTARHHQVLMTTIPNIPGWHAYVDGKPAPIKTAADTFIVVPLRAGKHHVALTYHTPWLRISAVISIVTWLLVGYAYYRQRQH